MVGVEDVDDHATSDGAVLRLLSHRVAVPKESRRIVLGGLVGRLVFIRHRGREELEQVVPGLLRELHDRERIGLESPDRDARGPARPVLVVTRCDGEPLHEPDVGRYGQRGATTALGLPDQLGPVLVVPPGGVLAVRSPLGGVVHHRVRVIEALLLPLPRIEGDVGDPLVEADELHGRDLHHPFGDLKGPDPPASGKEAVVGILRVRRREGTNRRGVGVLPRPDQMDLGQVRVEHAAVAGEPIVGRVPVGFRTILGAPWGAKRVRSHR